MRETYITKSEVFYEYNIITYSLSKNLENIVVVIKTWINFDRVSVQMNTLNVSDSTLLRRNLQDIVMME